MAELRSPIDVMYLIHKALRAEAARLEAIADQLEEDHSLQRFKLAFNSWATALVYHAEQEDRYVTAPMASSSSLGLGAAEDKKLQRLLASMMAVEDEDHRELLEKLQGVLTVLNQEIGKTRIIARTKQHLHQQVIGLRIVQEDHLETEEALVLPLVRRKMTEQQQLEVARGLLIDETAEDRRWVIEWLVQELTEGEQKWLARLEERFSGASIAAHGPLS